MQVIINTSGVHTGGGSGQTPPRAKKNYTIDEL